MILHVSQQEKLPENYYPTIQEAYDQLVFRHRRGMVDGPAEILVHKGDYVLKKSLHFYADLPVEIRPFGKDKVTISGGVPLKDWKKSKCNGKNVWKTTLPESVTDVPFLFIDGKLAQAARWPKKGYFTPTDMAPGFVTDDTNCDYFHCKKGDFNPKWYDPENISLKLLHKWVEEPLKVKSFDEKTNCIYTTSSLRYVVDAKTEYAFYNVKEALSEPGEYYFDRKTHELLVISGKADFQAVIPERETLVRFDSNAKWVTLSGLHFRYAGTHLPLWQNTLDLKDASVEPIRNYPVFKQGSGTKKDSMPCYSGAQGAVHVPGVILFRNTTDCAIKNCTISGCSWYGIHVLSGCSNLTFSGNEITGLGGGGFLIGGGNADAVKEKPETLTQRIFIRNNHIHDCGLFFYSALGVMITHACGCVVEGNHIHDLYYTGISCGWVWGYGDSVTRENSICRNHIHDIGKGVLSDMGGVYLLGSQPGTRVFENVIHDIVNRYYGGWGLYTDEGSSFIILERNVIYDCACEGFHQNFGRENIVRNNIFAFNREHGIRFSNNSLIGYAWPGEPHTKAINIYNNVILTAGTPAYSVVTKDLLKNNNIYSDCNVIYNISGKQKAFTTFGWSDEQGSISATEWKKKGLDRNSLFCDPGFRNAEKRDFRLKKDSPLWQYGFDFLEKLLK